MSTPREFDVSVESASPGMLTVRIAGELDMSTCDRVDDAVSSAPAADRLVIDLTDCTFVDSAGIRLLLALNRSMTSAGGRSELVASDPNILRVLEITGVSTMVMVHSTLDAAI